MVFIANNCTDDGESVRILCSFFSKFGPLSELNLGDGSLVDTLTDPGIDQRYHQVQHGNIQLTYLNTRTPGKANALNQASLIARQQGSIAMCIDSNEFVQPDAIACLSGAAYDTFVKRRQSNTKIALVIGKSMADRTPPPQTYLPDELKQEKSLQILHQIERTAPFGGWFMAWDPEVVIRLGHFPEVAVEEGAFILNAIKNGMSIKQVEQAIIWEIKPATLDERINTLSRLVRGRLQVMALYPEMNQYIRDQIQYERSGDRIEICGSCQIAKDSSSSAFGCVATHLCALETRLCQGSEGVPGAQVGPVAVRRPPALT